jgi:hypothetical protein
VPRAASRDRGGRSSWGATRRPRSIIRSPRQPIERSSHSPGSARPGGEAVIAGCIFPKSPEQNSPPAVKGGGPSRSGRPVQPVCPANGHEAAAPACSAGLAHRPGGPPQGYSVPAVGSIAPMGSPSPRPSCAIRTPELRLRAPAPSESRSGKRNTHRRGPISAWVRVRTHSPCRWLERGRRDETAHCAQVR